MAKLRIEANPVAAALPLAFALGVAVLARSGVGQGQDPLPLASVVGVVDVRAAIEQYPRYIKLRNEWEDMARAYQEQLDQVGQGIDELRATIGVLDEDSDEQRDKKFQLQLALQNQDYLRKKASDRMQFEELKITLRVYEDLDVAVAKVAKAKGLALVLRKRVVEPASTTVDKMSPRELQDRVLSFDRKQLLFASDALDITGDVVKLLMVPLENGNGGGDRAGDARQGAGSAKPSAGGGG